MRETEDQLKVIPQFCFPDAKDWAPVDSFPRSVQSGVAQKCEKQNRGAGNSRRSGKSSAGFLTGNHVSEQEKKKQKRKARKASFSTLSI